MRWPVEAVEKGVMPSADHDARVYKLEHEMKRGGGSLASVPERLRWAVSVAETGYYRFIKTTITPW